MEACPGQYVSTVYDYSYSNMRTLGGLRGLVKVLKQATYENSEINYYENLIIRIIQI